MAELDVQVRKWGDSYAVIIPKDIAKKENIHLKSTIHLKFEKEDDLSDVFGLLRGKVKRSAQEMKNEAREGWD